MVFMIHHGSRQRNFVIIFLLNYTLCHLTELPHRGNSNGMSQCIVSKNGIKNILNTNPVLIFI